MATVNDSPRETLLERFKRWWRIFWESQPPSNMPSPLKPKHATPQQGTGSTRYEIQDTNGQQVGESQTLADAHKQWQQKTGSQGRIIDRQTGEDVTPEPDMNGRYVVIDQSGQQVGSYDTKRAAEQAWSDLTSERGRIVDMKTKTDVTPRKGRLTSSQMDDVTALMSSAAAGWRESMVVDEMMARALLEKINHLPVSVFDMSNLKGNGSRTPTKTVTIKRREVRIEKVRRQVTVEEPGPPRPRGTFPVPYATDHSDVEFIRSSSDIRRLTRQSLGLPRLLLERGIAKKTVRRVVNLEEIDGGSTVRTRKVWREFEEPKVHEWEEKVEVAEEQEAQLLEIVIDVSLSMVGVKIAMAVALAAAVVGSHIDDDSWYMYRLFAAEVGRLREFRTPGEKRKLITKLMRPNDSLEAGTDILLAITMAARDVRSRARSGQSPQVLLITDGDSPLSSEDIYGAIGSDVVLHTVIVNDSNYSLRDRSTTYCELWSYDGIDVALRR